MSRSAAATTAGRQRSLPRSPAARHPRRVSGPARPPARVPAGLDPRALTASGAVAVPRSRALTASGAVAVPRSRALTASGAVAVPRPRALTASGAVAVPRPRPPRLPPRPPLRVIAGGAAIASRVAGVALDVSASRAMDRLVRSRAWIVIVAFGLIGIVAMQVSMLKLNAGIGRAVETVDTLERTNASLRGEVSRLSDGARIQSLAAARGFVMPAPADVTYLRAGDPRADGARAARRMVAADPAIAGPAGAATPLPIGQTPGIVPPAQAAAAVAPAPPAAPATPAATSAVMPPAAPPAAVAAPAPAAAPAAPASAIAPAAAPAAPAPATAPVANAAGGAPATAPPAVAGP